MAALLFAGLAGIEASSSLPEPVDVDPATLPSPTRLPTSLAEAVTAFEADPALTSAFGAELATTLMDVRRGEIARLGSLPASELCSVMRYLH